MRLSFSEAEFWELTVTENRRVISKQMILFGSIYKNNFLQSFQNALLAGDGSYLSNAGFMPVRAKELLPQIK
jgi:hypothetical protein